MVFWFAVRSPSVFRFVEPVIERLVAGGHRVEVSFDLVGSDEGPTLADLGARLGVRVSRLELGDPDRRTSRLILVLRALASYATYHRRWPDLLRDRWLDYFPSPVRRVLVALQRSKLHALVDSPPAGRALRRLARALPVPRALSAQLAGIAPDVVVASPAIFPDSREIEAIRAAKRLRIPTVVSVLSWDNLTSKGLLQAVPDRLLVWNEIQVKEAVEWHGIDSASIDVVGAPAFDYLFEADRRIDRDAFLEAVALPRGRRYVLYGASSPLGLGPGGEVELVRRVAAAIAQHDWPDAERPLVLVRRHPGNAEGWSAVSIPGVHVWADYGFPAADERRTMLYNGLVHAEAIVGLNTSLFVDAAIVDRPAVAILMESDARADRMPSRLVHFQNLVAAGFLELVDAPEDAAATVARIAAHGDPKQGARRDFVAHFVRPGGLDRSAADVAAERLASLG